MLKTCSWLIALAALVGLAGTSHAGAAGLVPLWMPQLYGQDAAPAMQRCADPQDVGGWSHSLGCPFSSFTGEAAATFRLDDDESSESDDPVADLFWDTLDVLTDYAPLVRILVHQCRPWTPYHLAAAAAFEYMAAMDAADRAADRDDAMIDDDKPDAPEMLPYPTVVGVEGCTAHPGCGEGCVVFGIGTSGPYVKQCQVAPACGVKSAPCGSGCPTVCAPAGCPAHATADTDKKSCKCCDDCQDCNNCKCGATVGRQAVQRPVCIQGVLVQPVRPGLPLGMPLPPPPPPFGPHVMLPLPPSAHPMLPPSPVDELHQLVRQRQMITVAIEQLEQELAWIATQQRVAQTPGVPTWHNAQKVHLVCEHFEVHCDAVHCVEGEPHRLVLEGDVQLACKTDGHCVRIEAPCVVINTRDGTFHVGTPSAAVPSAVRNAEHTGMFPPLVIWHPEVGARSVVPMPVVPVSAPGVPSLPGWRTPQRQAVTMPCPSTCPNPSKPMDDGDK